MSPDWPMVRLGEHVDACLGKMLDAKKNRGVLQPYLGNSNVRWGRFDLSDLAEMKFEPHEESRYGLLPGDLIVCEGGEPGRCAVWTAPVTNMRIQKALHRIRPKNTLNNYYLYYWFLHAARVGLLEPHFTGTTIKHLTGKAIDALEIPLPPIKAQCAIVDILRPLDDRIELANQENSTLGAIASALFKAWFIDFEPVRAKAEGREPEGMSADIAALFPSEFVDSQLGRIPRGWGVACLGDIGEVVDCLHSKKPEILSVGCPFIQLSAIRDDGLLDKSKVDSISQADYNRWISRIEVEAGDCVITNVGRVGAVSQIPTDYKAAMGRNMTAIRLKSSWKYPTFLIELLLSDAMRSEIARGTDVGTILNALNVRNIPKLRFVLPSKSVIEAFETSVRPLRRQMEMGLERASTLSNLRDHLLPALLSGRIDFDRKDIPA